MVFLVNFSDVFLKYIFLGSIGKNKMEMVKAQGLFPAWQELSSVRGFVCRFVPSMFYIWVCKGKKASQSPMSYW